MKISTTFVVEWTIRLVSESCVNHQMTSASSRAPPSFPIVLYPSFLPSFHTTYAVVMRLSVHAKSTTVGVGGSLNLVSEVSWRGLAVRLPFASWRAFLCSHARCRCVNIAR